MRQEGEEKKKKEDMMRNQGLQFELSKNISSTCFDYSSPSSSSTKEQSPILLSSSSLSIPNDNSSSQIIMKKVPRKTLAPLDDEILLKRCTHPLTTYFTGALLDFAEWDDPLRDSFVWSSKFLHLIR